MKVFRGVAVAAMLLAPIGLASCSSDDTAADTTVAAKQKGITIEKQWARTSPMATDMGAAYMNITSPVDDALLGASVDASVAGMTQIHETVMAEGMSESTEMGSGTTAAPAMTMQEVKEIALPAGEQVSLAPGGYHVMLMKLVAPLKVGTEITVTLTFKNAGEVQVTVPVLDEAP
jgi:copper(I)-binding protein